MNDLISRQAAIDAVYKCTDIFINNLPVMVDKADAYKALAELPSAQPEIVRCKDCKNNYNTCLNHGINQPMCDFTDRMLKETDFCSRAERREE